jgi:type VI secretion system protein ImpK
LAAKRAAAPRGLKGNLSDLCKDFFILGLQIRSGTVELPECRVFMTRVLQLFEAMKNKAIEAGFTPGDVEEAQYALAAFIDEMVQFSEWEGKHVWASNPLQAVLFGESIAGIKFFERLASVRRRSKEVVPIFYTCITLGFEGQYRMGNPAELGEVIEDLRRELTKGDKKTLSEHGGRPDEGSGASRGLPLVPMAGIAIALAIIVFVILLLVQNSTRKEAVDLLTQLGRG